MGLFRSALVRVGRGFKGYTPLTLVPRFLQKSIYIKNITHVRIVQGLAITAANNHPVSLRQQQ